jgi:hypothetical protein
MNGYAMKAAYRAAVAGLLIYLLLLGQLQEARSQDSKNLIQVLGQDGKPTALLEKVVVVSNRASIATTPDGSGEPIEPWAIFFRIKNDDGSKSPVNGKLRVGTSAGKAVGWIPEKDLRTWNTRFILDPIEPQGDRAFEVQLDGAVAKQNSTPLGKKRYALITDSASEDRGDDTQYPVVVYAGNVQGLNEGGTLSQQRNELKDVKLEIMFVIESSDLMFARLNKAAGDDATVMEYIKQAIRGLCVDLRKDPGIAAAVRLGFTEYKDSVETAEFTSRLTCDLTEDFDSFSEKLDAMAPSKLNDDHPDDVLAGLNTAAQKSSWSSNSVKHIILLGMMSCQLNPRGENPPQHGQPRNSVWDYWRPALQGYNSTGLSISQLISKARPQGGSDSTARTTRMFHSLWFGRDIYLSAGVEDPQAIRDSVEKVRVALSELSASDMAEAFPQLVDETQKIAALISLLTVSEHQRLLALSQYRDIASNNGDVDGIFMAVDPGPQNVATAVTGLSEKINETFSVLQKVRDGEGLQMPAAGGNEIAQPLFTLVGASAEKFKESPVLTGTASLRNDRGREVAFKKVMVSEDELRRLRSTLDSLHTTFKEMTRKADRQDVGSILDKMKNAIAATSAGQDIGANVKLKDLISDLPLRTAALDTTPQDLASMTSEAFTEWLDRLESAKFRIDDLLNATQEWLTLSDSAVNDKFTFLRLSELP